MIALVLAQTLIFQPLNPPQTVSGVGAAQGVEWRDDHLYVYGDAETGVIRELVLDAEGRLLATGRSVRLTQRERDRVAHPTGLTFHPADPRIAYLGDTVAGQGRIYILDWDKLWQEGNLDNAILNVVEDDTAVQGSRPEMVRLGGRWLLATSDYGNAGNEIRLYDPDAIKSARRSSDPGVLVARISCGPWVQTLHWIDEIGGLVLVQNQIEGLRWRLSMVDLEGSLAAGTAAVVQQIDFAPRDELEGFHLMADGWAAFVSSSARHNLITTRVRLER